jgi:hypothetical protein
VHLVKIKPFPRDISSYLNSNAQLPTCIMSIDIAYYCFLRKDLKKILRRIEIGLEDSCDLSIGSGIINTFLDAPDPELKAEANRYLERFPVFRKFLTKSISFL